MYQKLLCFWTHKTCKQVLNEIGNFGRTKKQSFHYKIKDFVCVKVSIKLLALL